MAESAGALIYVVEDESAVRDLIVGTLHRHGFRTRAFGSGGALLRQLTAQAPALCLVDLGLPDVDGMELVRAVAARWDCGLLILSGRGHPVDRATGLEWGADDYVVKPFEARELVARVRSILRRRRIAALPQPADPGRRYARFGGWRYDASAQVLLAPDGHEHTLDAAEARLLRALLERPQQVVARDDLLARQPAPERERRLDVRVERLCRRLEGLPGSPKCIKNVYGLGYMLLCEVEWA